MRHVSCSAQHHGKYMQITSSAHLCCVSSSLLACLSAGADGCVTVAFNCASFTASAKTNMSGVLRSQLAFCESLSVVAVSFLFSFSCDPRYLFYSEYSVCAAQDSDSDSLIFSQDVSTVASSLSLSRLFRAVPKRLATVCAHFNTYGDMYASDSQCS